MSSSRLNTFHALVQYRDVANPGIEEHFYSCLRLSELAHNIHIQHGTTPDSALWSVFYDNRRIDATLGVLDVSLKNSD